MSDTIYRLLGPHHNRLVTVIDAERLLPGQVSTKTGAELQAAGWLVYVGPAKAPLGWVEPESDPALRPRPLKAS